MHHRHGDIGLLQGAQRIHRIQLVGDDFRFHHQPLEIDGDPVDHPRQNFAYFDNAEDFVRRAIRNRQKRMRAGINGCANLIFVGINIDPVDFGARRHHFAHRALRQPHSAGQDLMLLCLDHARIGRIGKDHLQFFGCHRRLSARPYAEKANQQAGGCVENPHQRRGNPGKQRHRPRHNQRNRHGCAQCQLLGHQLSDNQTEIGCKRNHQRKTGIIGKFIRNAQTRQPLAHRSAQTRARIGTGDNTDQRNANLDGGEEFARIGRQSHRSACCPAAFFLGSLQARCARRHNRKLRHGKDAIEHDKPADNQQICPRKRCHPSPLAQKQRRASLSRICKFTEHGCSACVKSDTSIHGGIGLTTCRKP